MPSLFGDEFDIVLEKDSAKKAAKKAKAVKQASSEELAEKMMKSKSISLEERLAIINARVAAVLGKQAKNVLVIKSKTDFDDYISSAIQAGRIAIDTETWNSLDPVTTKLMGLCLYYPGGKQAYIPVNHRNPTTKEHLSWQLTEADCKEELQKVVDSHELVIMHNGKFDYEVLKCTCGIAVKPDWDTMIAARLLNENEPASLKWQYVNKIDKEQEKYSIDKLFENVLYADVDPEVFALYAATDSLMTDKLYEIQAVEMQKPDYGPHLDLSGKHEIKGLRWLFHNVEMPIVIVTAEMELAGVRVDEAYGERLKTKYYGQLEAIDAKISKAMKNLAPTINAWKLTPKANAKLKLYPAKKTKMSQEKIEATYDQIDEFGNRYKIGKSPIEILEDPINLDSPTQLAVFFYDILEVPPVKENSRATGKDDLKAIKEKLAEYVTEAKDKAVADDELELDEDGNVIIENEEDAEDVIQVDTSAANYYKYVAAADICTALLDRRKIMKLITTYIDVIPTLAKHWPDGRIRFHLNSVGTDTGRYSSGGKIAYCDGDDRVEVSGINIQNIPSHNPEIRALFEADIKEHKVKETDDCFIVPETDEVETNNGWKLASELNAGDSILVDNSLMQIVSIGYNKASRDYCIEI